VIEAFHQKEIVKPMEEEFLILLQECCKSSNKLSKARGKIKTKTLIISLKSINCASYRSKTREPNQAKASKLRMRKNEAIKLRSDGMSLREMGEYFKMDHTTIQKEMKKWH